VVKALYNVHKDPGETKNLIEEYPDIALDLEKQMRAWQESVLLSLTEKDYKN
jgi:hypothetical protein